VRALADRPAAAQAGDPIVSAISPTAMPVPPVRPQRRLQVNHQRKDQVMSATSEGRFAPSERRRGSAAAGYKQQEMSGWVMFAGAMLMIVSILNFIYGIAAIGQANFYVANAHYVFSDLNTWGWIVMILGSIQFFGACAIFMASGWGRWIGILSAGVNAIVQLLWIPSYPWLSLALFAVDLLVLYGLIARWVPGRDLA
jgi:hypothetical protein